MFEFKTINGIMESLNWIITLGKSDIDGVKEETNELIRELSKSLKNLWDITKEITKIPVNHLTKEKFDDRYDYFFTFYLGDENISAARTHCGNVLRDVKRIKFKLAKILHTNIGKWKEADEKLNSIVEEYPNILEDYNKSIASLESRMKEIRAHFDSRDVASARQSYATLKRDLENDIKRLRKGVLIMEEAIEHVNKITG
jgi:hypothetical protein